MCPLVGVGIKTMKPFTVLSSCPGKWRRHMKTIISTVWSVFSSIKLWHEDIYYKIPVLWSALILFFIYQHAETSGLNVAVGAWWMPIVTSVGWNLVSNEPWFDSGACQVSNQLFLFFFELTNLWGFQSCRYRTMSCIILTTRRCKVFIHVLQHIENARRFAF